MHRGRNVLRFGGIAVLLLLGAGVGLWRLFGSDPGADAIPVTLAAARTTTLQAQVVGNCTFRPRRSVTVVSDSGGRVAAIPVAVGAAVTAGQVLVRLDADDLRVALRQAEAARRAAEVNLLDNLVSLRSSLRSARTASLRTGAALARQRELYAAGRASREELRQAEQAQADAAEELRSARERLNLATGRAVDAEPPSADDGAGDGAVLDADPEVIRARLSEQQAALDLTQATIVAPLAGTVTELKASLGNHLAPGAEVATVATLDDVIAEVKVDEVDVGKIRVGQEVELTSDSVRDVQLRGAIALVPPTMTDYEVTVEVDVDGSGLPAGVQLRAGASCRARIEAELKSGATAVPFAALQERPGGSVAFVAVPEGAAQAVEVAGGLGDAGEAGAAGGAGAAETGGALYRLQRRDVTLGVSSVNEVEITAGLEAGELVVVGNLSLLRDGLLVMQEPAAEPGADPEAAPPPGEEQDPAP